MKLTRAKALDIIHIVLKSYQKKIRDACGYTECLPVSGHQIVSRYKKNNEYQALLDELASSKEALMGMSDDILLAYVNICYELNKTFDLKVSGSKKIDRIAKDAEDKSPVERFKKLLHDYALYLLEKNLSKK